MWTSRDEPKTAVICQKPDYVSNERTYIRKRENKPKNEQEKQTNKK